MRDRLLKWWAIATPLEHVKEEMIINETFKLSGLLTRSLQEYNLKTLADKAARKIAMSHSTGKPHFYVYRHFVEKTGPEDWEISIRMVIAYKFACDCNIGDYFYSPKAQEIAKTLSYGQTLKVPAFDRNNIKFHHCYSAPSTSWSMPIFEFSPVSIFLTQKADGYNENFDCLERVF